MCRSNQPAKVQAGCVFGSLAPSGRCAAARDAGGDRRTWRSAPWENGAMGERRGQKSAAGPCGTGGAEAPEPERLRGARSSLTIVPVHAGHRTALAIQGHRRRRPESSHPGAWSERPMLSVPPNGDRPTRARTLRDEGPAAKRFLDRHHQGWCLRRATHAIPRAVTSPGRGAPAAPRGRSCRARPRSPPRCARRAVRRCRG